MRSHNHEFYYIMAKCCVDGELSHGRMAFFRLRYTIRIPLLPKEICVFYAHTPHGTEGVNLYWEGFFNAKSKQNFT